MPCEDVLLGEAHRLSRPVYYYKIGIYDTCIAKLKLKPKFRQSMAMAYALALTMPMAVPSKYNSKAPILCLHWLAKLIISPNSVLSTLIVGNCETDGFGRILKQFQVYFGGKMHIDQCQLPWCNNRVKMK